MMKAFTIPDVEYTVVAPEGERCEVTANVNGARYTLAVAFNGEQVRFQAVSGEVEISSPKAIVRPLTGLPAQTATPDDAGVMRELNTPQGSGNTWWNYAVLNPALLLPGMLQRVAIKARNSSSGAHEIWLGVFEQPENGSDNPEEWAFIGASDECVVQQNGTMSVWTFKGVRLSGRPIALCGMAARNTGWNMATQVGAYAARRTEGDTLSRLVSANATLEYVPQMVACIREKLTTALGEHLLDAVVHITGAERTAWNGKANAADLQAHTEDAVAHITAEERAKWNAKADASALSGKVNTATYTGHTGDKVAHLSAAEHTGLTALLEKKDALLSLLDAPEA